MKSVENISSFDVWDQPCNVPYLPHLNAEMKYIYFFLGVFSKQTLVTSTEMNNGLQTDFSLDLNNFMHTQPDCFLLK